MRIKCPHCNGKGFSELNSAVHMTCGWCMGQGELDLEIVPTEPQTNEEWFCGLSTEEKAKWMFRLTYKCYWCGREYEKTKKYNEKECPFQKCLDDSKGFKEWLKEKHHE